MKIAKSEKSALIIDTSAVVDLVSGSRKVQNDIAKKIDQTALYAPALIEYEFYAWLSRHFRNQNVSEEKMSDILRWYTKLNVIIISTKKLAFNIISLTGSVSAYDAAFVALCAKTGYPLLTTDKRLATGAKGHCEIILVEK
jgi:predicted nucleic acid-binding protein